MAKTKKAKAPKFDFRTIKSFEDACQKLNMDPKNLPSLNGEFEKPIIAAFKLMIIFKVINNGWIPDWNNWDQYKYFPWFGVLSSGFGFLFSTYDYVYTYANVGSRLCTDTSEKALYIAETFKPLYEDFFLLK